MKSLRKMDELCHSLSIMQGRLFERSVEKLIPSYFFIKSFMLSEEARALDDLNLEKAGITEVEIFNSIKTKIDTTRGSLLPYPIMRFIGYFYRSASYIYNVSSKYLYEHIPVKSLISSYDALHSLPIEEAIKDMFSIHKIELKTKEEQFSEEYKKNSNRVGVAKREMNGFELSLEEFNSIPVEKFDN